MVHELKEEEDGPHEMQKEATRSKDVGDGRGSEVNLQVFHDEAAALEHEVKRLKQELKKKEKEVCPQCGYRNGEEEISTTCTATRTSLQP